MRIGENDWRTIWLENQGQSIGLINQNHLPHNLVTCSINSCKEVADAISSMVVRGAPLIGVAGAYGLMLALKDDPSDASLNMAFKQLASTRPTAVNLRWALQRILEKVTPLSSADRFLFARQEASLIAEEDISMCETIGNNGLKIIRKVASTRPIEYQDKPLNILTHCNAGWLAAVDWGTALAPIYKAHRAQMKIHVWVSETRPRNQGSSLTAYELGCEGIPHTLIVDNAGGHLMQEGKVDLVIVGSDRTTSSGDVCNKIGTYMKALAAFDNGIPFYVALPSSTIDWSIKDGIKEIPIEARSSSEVTHINGLLSEQLSCKQLVKIKLSPDSCEGFNPAFDVTPARLVTGLITDRGVAAASEKGLKSLYPEKFIE